MTTAYVFNGTSYYSLSGDRWVELNDFDLTQTLGELGADGIEVYGADCTDSMQPWILQESEDDCWTMENTPYPFLALVPRSR